MEPALHNGQIVLLRKNYEELERGDIVAFQCPAFSATLVKRVVGVPGDTVQITEGKLLVNGEFCEFYSEQFFEYAGVLDSPCYLDSNEYIVIGDNISESKDSRYPEVGIVSKTQIFGKVIN